MTLKPRPLVEAMTEQLGKQCFILAQGDDAIPDVTRRKHVELFPQSSTGAAIITNRDDCREVANRRFAAGDRNRIRGRLYEALQSLEQRRQAGSAPNCHYSKFRGVSGLIP